MSAPAALGLDLGTSNTTLALAGRPLPLGATGSLLLPSALALLPTGAHLVGEPARRRRMIDGANVILSAKRILGASPRSAAVARYRATTRAQLVETEEGGVAFQTRRGIVTPEGVATELTRTLFSLAGVAMEGTVVVGAPVSYDATRRRAIADAVRAAGCEDVEVHDEPALTAVAYLNRSSLRRAVVYDLGGGTFDAAVIDATSLPLRVLAVGGDEYLGGEDIDAELAQIARDQVLTKHGWDIGADAAAAARILDAAERAKLQLTLAESATIAIGELDPAAPDLGSIALTRDHLTAVVQPFLQRTFVILDDVLARARTKPSEVDAVFLAGGSTRLPALQEGLRVYFGKRARQDVDPTCCVAIGASLVASRPDVRRALSEHPGVDI